MLACLMVMAVFAQDNSYWAVYHFEVKPGHESEVVSAMDRFFASETGKQLPPANLGARLFGSSKDKFTHDIVFYSTDKSVLGKMYSGMLTTSKDMMLLDATFNRSIKGVASYLGKSLITGTPNPAHVVSTIFEMSISDPTTYAAAFTTFRNAILAKSGGKMSMDLHQFLSGNEPGATHVVVVSTASVSDMLDMTDLIYSSSDFATYAAKVKDIRKVLRTFTMVTAKMYNMPEGM